MEDSKSCTCLSACALGLALGITFSLGMLLVGLLALCGNIGVPFVTLMSSVYVGFAVSAVGILIGMIWAFVDGFICGFLIAYLYNFIHKHCHCKSCHPDKK